MSDTGYPPPHLIPRKTRVTTLPMMAFMGLIESAPIYWEQATKVWDLAEYHHLMHSERLGDLG